MPSIKRTSLNLPETKTNSATKEQARLASDLSLVAVGAGRPQSYIFKNVRENNFQPVVLRLYLEVLICMFPVCFFSSLLTHRTTRVLFSSSLFYLDWHELPILEEARKTMKLKETNL